MYDLKITNGKIFNFNKNEKKVLELAIKNDTIRAIGKNLGPAKKEINAKKNIISPGFIDIHMHEEKIGNTCNEDDYDIANRMLKMGVTTAVGGNCGKNSQDTQKFIEFIDENGAPINYIMMTGHNYLRNLVGIKDRYREATNEEIEKMKKILRKEVVENGSIGVSFGLEYSPGVTKKEIIKLIEAIKDLDILIAAHYRDDADEGITSIKELIDISRQTQKPIQISHIGSCAAFGMMSEALKLIKEARNEGLSIEADCYPYNAFSTHIGSAVFDEGCFEAYNKPYSSILFTEKPYKETACDKKTFKKVRKKHPNMLVIAKVMNEKEVIEAIKTPFVNIASDGLYNKGQGHPRGAGTFPRVLGKYVREEGALSLIKALKKMTLNPAKRLGLKNKGELKIGYDADLVIFNPDIIIDKATFESPLLSPVGIKYVIIDGKIALKDNEIQNNRLGKSTKRKFI